MSNADIGLIGLAVMGENLVLNMESNGFTVAVFNRSTEKVTKFVEGRGKGKSIIGTYSIEELVRAVKRPRKVMIMVQAGKAVDAVIDQLLPLLEDGDILIDGGNSRFTDTIRDLSPLDARIADTFLQRPYWEGYETSSRAMMQNMFDLSSDYAENLTFEHSLSGTVWANETYDYARECSP